MKNLKFILVAVVMLFSAVCVSAQDQKPTGLLLPSVVSSNMVLQQNETVNIWGWAKPKAKVTVAADWIEGKPMQVKADKEGFWIVPLQTTAASFAPHTIVITAGKERAELNNILFGEVWLCAGQSNMEFKVGKTTDLKADLKGDMNTAIRLFCTGRISSETPQNDVPQHNDGKGNYNTKWVECNATDLAVFSAVAYGFGKELQESLQVPIGLIDASFGGTFIEGWIKKEVIDADTKVFADCNKIKHKVWAGKPSHLYNANIYPIRHTSIAGVIWYQGCANVSSSPRGYAHSLEVLINSWREEFRNPDMPFYIVELVPYTYGAIKGGMLRESQAKVAAKVANCEMVATNDQVDIPADIHPRNKAVVAHRLAQCALGGHYGKEVGQYRAPAYESMSVEGDKIRIRFKNVPTSLVSTQEKILGFQIGMKHPKNEKLIKFALAEASIEADNSILVWSNEITAPIAVRYCFTEEEGTIRSAEGLPLVAFRTDKNHRSLCARPYVEAPSEIAITFEGPGYKRSEFKKGAHMWPNLKQKLSNTYPSEYEGFQMLTSVSKKKVKTPGGKITAHGDGYVYCLVRSTGDMQKIEYKSKWRIMVPTYTKAITPEGKKIASQYIARHPVKAGDVVQLPRVRDHYSVFVLAKEINYIDTAEQQ